MQFQIECNSTPFQTQLCLICDQQFEMTEAKVILCNDQGKSYGEVCPHCLKEGFTWISDRFTQLNQVKQPKKLTVARHTRNRKMPVGV